MALIREPERHRTFPLLLDEPTDIDLLSFDAVASTVVDAVLDEHLDPIALGLSGSWGSGKTSVLRIIATQLRQNDDDKLSTLVIETDPWRYDPQLGAKESLIGEILGAISSEINENATGAEKAKSVLSRLVKRVEWGKALQIAAKSAISFQLPSIESVLELVKPKTDDEDAPIKDMVEFRKEFENLLKSDALEHVRNVVILVDDLDRCLPDTVVDTLETIRLFLSVPKMSFVIAADEERIAEAIATRYPTTGEVPDGEEPPSRLYLHKIVQTSVPVPALSDFDTEAYLVMLQIQSSVEPSDYSVLIRDVAEARRAGVGLDNVSGLGDSAFQEARATALRLKPIVHEKTRGNPRRIKRFLNDVSVRRGIASRRGIELDAATIAKLMVLESYFPDEFKRLTGWLTENKLKENLRKLERAAGTDSKIESEVDNEPTLELASSNSKATKEKAPSKNASDKEFTDELLRWARISPTLHDLDIASYLVFAASFQSIFLTAKGLSERLRDLATSLLSSSIADNRSITDEMFVVLTDSESRELSNHIGGVIVDQPKKQSQGVAALLRLSRARPDSIPHVSGALKRLSVKDIKPGSLLQLKHSDDQTIIGFFQKLVDASADSDLKSTLAVALEVE